MTDANATMTDAQYRRALTLMLRAIAATPGFEANPETLAAALEESIAENASEGKAN
jgi:hypothetical protein